MGGVGGLDELKFEGERLFIISFERGSRSWDNEMIKKENRLGLSRVTLELGFG